jgi:hypothetical protein
VDILPRQCTAAVAQASFGSRVGPITQFSRKLYQPEARTSNRIANSYGQNVIEGCAHCSIYHFWKLPFQEVAWLDVWATFAFGKACAMHLVKYHHQTAS